MAGGGYRGILAAVPTAQNLRSASRGGVYRKSKNEAACQPTWLFGRVHTPALWLPH
jgi:hypothetical protein